MVSPSGETEAAATKSFDEQSKLLSAQKSIDLEQVAYVLLPNGTKLPMPEQTE